MYIGTTGSAQAGNNCVTTANVIPNYNYDPQLRQKLAKQTAERIAEMGRGGGLSSAVKGVLAETKKDRDSYRQDLRDRTARALLSTGQDARGNGGGDSIDMSMPQPKAASEMKVHRKQMRRHKQQRQKEAAAKAKIHAAKESGLHTAADRKRAAVVATALARQTTTNKKKKNGGGKVPGVSGSKSRGHAGAADAAVKKMKRGQRAR